MKENSLYIIDNLDLLVIPYLDKGNTFWVINGNYIICLYKNKTIKIEYTGEFFKFKKLVYIGKVKDFVEKDNPYWYNKVINDYRKGELK